MSSKARSDTQKESVPSKEKDGDDIHKGLRCSRVHTDCRHIEMSSKSRLFEEFKLQWLSHIHDILVYLPDIELTPRTPSIGTYLHWLQIQES